MDLRALDGNRGVACLLHSRSRLTRPTPYFDRGICGNFLPVELVDITAIVEFPDEMGVPKRQRIVTGDVGIAPNR